MKKLSITFMLLAFCLVNFSFTNNEVLDLKGEWGPRKVPRSLPTAKPTATIEDYSLTIYFPDYLTDVSIALTNSEGTPIYNACISTPYSGYALNIPLPTQPDNYVITLSHSLGVLTADFQIE